VQICDLDRARPLVESHVRIYCVNHRKMKMNNIKLPSSKSIKEESEIMEPCRLSSPDDELGGVTFLSLPTKVHHTIDKFSPLNENQVSERNERNYEKTLAWRSERAKREGIKLNVSLLVASLLNGRFAPQRSLRSSWIAQL